jgi:transcriptional regulator with XRE-family HTH domain
MSRPISEKILVLRGFLDLTRVEFSESIGFSINTLKAIEQKGVTPKSDVLVRIANTWPKYANWLLLGEGSLESLEALDKGLENYAIIDSVDARFMEQCVVKSDRLSKLVFLQSEESEDLAALFLIDQPALYAISNSPKCVGSVWVKSGNMNFTRNNGGGWSVLRSFRSWLIEENSDLVRKAELYQIDQIVMNYVYRTLSIEKNALKTAVKNERYDNFLRWKEGKGY